MPKPLRIALTIPGAVALGAYEAGALAALVNGVRAANATGEHAIDIDVIGSSSSGSLTALLTARCLLEGMNPVRILGTAWVQQASLRRLLGRGFQAPLSFRNMRHDAVALLDPAGAQDTESTARQTADIRLSLAVQSLRGLAYRRPPVATPSYETVTHLDWMDYTIEQGMTLEELTEPLAESVLGAVLASAANQLAFPPQLLARPLDQHPYVDIRNPPERGLYWCTDAAILDLEPIGRSLAVARTIDGSSPEDVPRLHVVVEPQPRVAARGSDWSDPAARPSWLQVLGRTAAIVEAQSVFDDISGIDDCNTRLRAIGDLLARLEPVLAELPPEWKQRFTSALGYAAGTSLAEGLRRDLAAAAQVTGRRELTVEVISPDLVQTGAGSVNDRLAGELFYRFGGLLDEQLRQSDFDLGYKSTLVWFGQGGLGDASAVAAVAAGAAHPAADRIGPGWVPPELSLAGRLRMIPMLWRLSVVTVHDLVVGRRGRQRAVPSKAE